ncbi:MAG: glycosyltransferase [Clostridia bacterium]|nr:glycosyltransferase [Clostridia bacterium]
MKKILIINNNMQIGGIQKALANLLSEIAPYYEITLFLIAPEGALMKEIPETVRVAKANRFVRALGLTHAQAKNKGIFMLLWRGLLVVLTRILKTKVVFPLLGHMEKIDGDYDAAISYMQNGAENCFYGGCAELVLHAAKAKQKICFIHCDMERYEGKSEYNIKTLMQFDKVAAVSDSVKKQILKVAPQLESKVVTVHNCYNCEQIATLSKAYDAPYTDGKINLFSAARLRREKGIVRIIPMLGKIRDAGVDFVWRIAGDGPDWEKAEKLIKEYKLEQQIILLGMLENPYPHLKAADVLLVPSYDEAAPMVFGEARILGTPIWTTDTASAYEMVQEPDAGQVLSNDDDTLQEELLTLLKEFHDLQFQKSEFDNKKAVEEFDGLIMA